MWMRRDSSWGLGTLKPEAGRPPSHPSPQSCSGLRMGTVLLVPSDPRGLSTLAALQHPGPSPGGILPASQEPCSRGLAQRGPREALHPAPLAPTQTLP